MTTAPKIAAAAAQTITITVSTASLIIMEHKAKIA